MSRLNISHNVVSKRKVERLIKEGYVQGYDDPRVIKQNYFQACNYRWYVKKGLYRLGCK